MQDTFRPIFTAPTTFEDESATFHTYKQEVKTSAPIEAINDLIRACDGNHSLDEIIDQLKDGWSEESVRGLLKTLHNHNVIVDGRNLSQAFWPAVQNPTPLPTTLNDNEISRLVQKAASRHKAETDNKSSTTFTASSSAVQDLLSNRRSVRNFAGKPISQQDLVDILWSAYGEIQADAVAHRRTVPSAGALFPLKIGLMLFEPTAHLDSGVYEAILSSPEQISFSQKSEKLMTARRSFVDPMRVSGAAGAIVINGSFEISAEKYGNRSVPYVNLEAGHVAQNIHIAASERGVATVEVGGFYEDFISSLQNLPEQYTPLVSVVFGAESEGPRAHKTPDGIDLWWPAPLTDEYQLPYSMALARITEVSERNWSSGKAEDPQLAKTKALAEAREWDACGNVAENTVSESFNNLGSAIDPRDIVEFHDEQYQREDFPLEKFEPGDEHIWIGGTDELSGDDIFVPADAVYYPDSLPDPLPRYMHANTSGVAAHPKREQAVRSGVLELIERDGFMVTYLTQIKQPSITIGSLPERLQSRIERIKACGFSIWIKDFSLGLAPVMFVFAQSTKHKVTTCGACADFDKQHAVDHALKEVEQSILNCMKGGLGPDTFDPDEVGLTEDHGKLYAQANHYKKADFLVKGGGKVYLSSAGDNSADCWNELVSKISADYSSLITIPLSDRLDDQNQLHIIRSIIPGLVPMVFGHGMEPAAMERIYQVAQNHGKSITYNDLPSYPHPFA